MKIAVAIPTHDMVPAGFMFDLANMMKYTMAVMPEGVQLGLNMLTETYIHRARQDLAEALITQDVDYILWLDSDMRFPGDTLLRLLKHQEDVVGINYIKRGIPSDYVAIKKRDWDGTEPPKRLVTDDDSTGLEQVDAIGFGVVLIRVGEDTFPNRPEPWFMFDWMPDTENHVGEDAFYCKLLKKQGVSVYVDHDLSKECAHIGSFEYRLEHLQAQREAE